MSEKSDLATKYQKLDDISHVLLRPNTYVGGIDRVAAEVWVYDDAKIRERVIDYNAALYKIFDEAIMNARDHHVRTSLAIAAGASGELPVTSIAVDVSLETGAIKITNNGTAIPIEIHPEHKIYVIEMIFGHLRSSTNYNEAETRIGAGVNGVGIKCAFIFSKFARVEVVDQASKKRYVQEFRNNLREICPPVITKTKAGDKSSVSIEFIPEYERFGFPSGLTPDFFALLKKRTYDIAAVTEKTVKVSFNGEILPIKTFKQYISMYIGDEDKFVYEENSARWEYAVALSSTNEFSQISFVNGIFTRNGGKHVEYILNQITKKIADFIEKKKKIQVRPAAIKEQLVLFLRCDIENPAFDSQSKDCMTLPIPKFGSTCTVSDAFCEKIAKMGVMDQACSVTEARENRTAAKKTDGSKTRTVRGIANFIDANYAGSDKSGDCTLILCEGLSAQSGVISGLSSADRNFIGIYPLKGKVLNVRGETARKISENKEITDLKKIMGLENGRKYTAADIATKLRYGKIMILTDADADGSHIKALCVNLFHCEWSTLVKIQGFLSFMNTPILRATRGKQTLSFYNQHEYDLWKEQQTPAAISGWKIKYFKGLGTSTSAEFKEYFTNKKKVDFAYTEKVTDDRIDQIFNKKRADERKKWLENYDKNLYLDTSNPVVKYEDFIDRELIHFSVYDCERSIPNLMDGLKISLRKILFCAFKRKLTSEVKVAQFSGYVSEHSMYHHGEQSLHSATINMAQNFVGSNNINLLEPKGQFGCLAPDTPILMWDASIKEAKDIVVGDVLVGDDGEKRIVLKTTSGIDDMYEITDLRGKTMTVNSQHILTLYYSKNFEIYWKENCASWYMNYYDSRDEKIYIKAIKTSLAKTKNTDHFNKSVLSKEDAYNQMLKLKDSLVAELSCEKVIDIKLENYLKLSKYNKRSLFSISNTKNIKMEKQDVPISPYIFGLWLGDGDHNGHGFTTIDDEIVKEFAIWADSINAEITHNNSSNGRDDCYHYEIRRKGSGKLVSIGDKENSSKNCKACSFSKIKHPSCDWVFEKTEPVVMYGITKNGQKRWDLNPFKEILKKNNLYKNKDIPECYINNDEETRLQILAGFIDTDGTLKNNDIGCPSYEISQCDRLHGNLIDKINIIAQSLGFATSIQFLKYNKQTSKGEDMKMKVVRIFGDLERIPCRLERKKVVSQSRVRHSAHYSTFTVKHIGKGEFCGWQIDKNERFLLGNYTVTHNSRLQGGDDSASERYIFTQLNELARNIFPEADDQVLTYINDDGTMVEPEFYVPIIPFALVNGQKGIGTGFATSIPPYNPLDLIGYLRYMLTGGAGATAAAAAPPTLNPYYEGFKGTVTKIASSKYLIKGVYEKTGEDRITITELPIGTWTMPYITFLEELLEPPPDKAGKKVTPLIKDFANMSTETNILIHIVFPRGKLAELEAAVADGINGVHKLLKLTTTVSTTNMNLFTSELKLKKYDTPEEIIADYFGVRMDAYVRRKKYLLENLEFKLLKMTNKARYIQAVLDDVIDLRKKTNQQVDDMLTEAGFDRIDDNFKYLTKLPMDSVSKENVESILRERDETEREFNILKNTSETDMWLSELAALEQKYLVYKSARHNYLKDEHDEETKTTARAGGGKKRNTSGRRVVKLEG